MYWYLGGLKNAKWVSLKIVEAYTAHEGKTDNNFKPQTLPSSTMRTNQLGAVECFIHIDPSVFGRISANAFVSQLSL